MKLLVTGGAGFIGSNFVKYWLNTYRQDEVVVLDALTHAGHLSNLRELAYNSSLYLEEATLELKVTWKMQWWGWTLLFTSQQKVMWIEALLS